MGRYFRRQGLSEVDAQDYVQETLVRIVQKGGVGGLDSPQGYVFSVAANLLRDRARRAKTRAKDAHVQVQDEWLRSDAPSAHRNLAGREELERIKLAIMNLPKKSRRVFILNRFEGLSYREISELMGVSRSSVEKYMMSAIARLREVRDTPS